MTAPKKRGPLVVHVWDESDPMESQTVTPPTIADVVSWIESHWQQIPSADLIRIASACLRHGRAKDLEDIKRGAIPLRPSNEDQDDEDATPTGVFSACEDGAKKIEIIDLDRRLRCLEAWMETCQDDDHEPKACPRCDGTQVIRSPSKEPGFIICPDCKTGYPKKEKEKADADE